MDTIVPVAVVGLAVFFLLGLPMLGRMSDARLGERWGAVAPKLGLQPLANTETLAAELKEFRRVRKPRVYAALRGELDGVPARFCLFRFWFVQAGGRSSQEKNGTGVILEIAAPEFLCTHSPDRNTASEGRALLASLMPSGVAPVRFSGDPDFGAAFLVTGPHHREIEAFFTDGVRRSLPREPGRALHSNGKRLLWLIEHVSHDETGLPNLIAEARSVAQSLNTRTTV